MEQLRCPIENPKGYIQALNTPQAEVAGIFANLTSDPGFFGDRGGTRLPKKPVFFQGNKGLFEKSRLDYGRESTFTTEQRRLLIPTILTFNGLIEGKIYDHNGASSSVYPSFGTELVTSVQEAKEGNTFADEAKQTLKGLLDRFASHYPNLLPALHGMFEVAGAEGAVATIVLADRYIRAASNGEMTIDNMDTFEAEDYAQDAFIIAHTYTRYDTGKHYGAEVWCTGQTIAHALIPQLKHAALKVVALGIDTPKGKPYTNDPQNIQEFRSYMKQVVAQEKLRKEAK